jgi:hypothetical protein
VSINSAGANQTTNVSLKGMPKKTGFILFIIQQPDSPFGLAWYQGDIDTDKDVKGSVKVKGIFSDEDPRVRPVSSRDGTESGRQGPDDQPHVQPCP